MEAFFAERYSVHLLAIRAVMRMKAIGLIAELERGASAALPRINELRDKLTPALAHLICDYLDSGVTAIDIMEASQDPLSVSTFIPGGPSLVSDGTWVWRKDLSYFVRNYLVWLDEHFVSHVLHSGTSMPEVLVVSKCSEIKRAYQEAREGKSDE